MGLRGYSEAQSPTEVTFTPPPPSPYPRFKVGWGRIARPVEQPCTGGEGGGGRGGRGGREGGGRGVRLAPRRR